jgi:hypothetical protein
MIIAMQVLHLEDEGPTEEDNHGKNPKCLKASYSLVVTDLK